MLGRALLARRQVQEGGSLLDRRGRAIEGGREIHGPLNQRQVAWTLLALTEIEGVLESGARVAAQGQADGGQLQIGPADGDHLPERSPPGDGAPW